MLSVNATDKCFGVDVTDMCFRAQGRLFARRPAPAARPESSSPSADRGRSFDSQNDRVREEGSRSDRRQALAQDPANVSLPREALFGYVGT